MKQEADKYYFLRHQYVFSRDRTRERRHSGCGQRVEVRPVEQHARGASGASYVFGNVVAPRYIDCADNSEAAERFAERLVEPD